MYLLVTDIAELLINKGAFLAVASLSLLGLIKAWREYLQNELDKVKVREDAKVAIAKENSAGAQAIISLQKVDEEFSKRIQAIENDIENKYHFAEQERANIKRELEGLKREHTDFINKSLEYFMGRKT